MNFSKKELHQLAGKIIENKQENVKKTGKKINAIYAVHQRADGTNGHLHIVFHAEKKAVLEAAKINYKSFSKDEMKNWILERSSIVNSVKAISEVEKARNIERLSSLEGLKRETGTEKRDAIIERYQGKSEHNSGNFSLIQVEKSFEHSVSKGRMSESWKNKFLGEIQGRLKSLEKAQIAKNLGNNKWKIDREKWIEFQKDLKEQKLDKVSQKVQKTIQEHTKKNINSLDYTVRVVPNLENIDQEIEKLFEQKVIKKVDNKLQDTNMKKDEISDIKSSNSFSYSSRVTPKIYDVDEFFEKNFSPSQKISPKEKTIDNKRAEKTIQEDTKKNINSIDYTVRVVPNLENIDQEIEKLFEQKVIKKVDNKLQDTNMKKDKISDIKSFNSLNYSSRMTQKIYDVDEFFENNFSQDLKFLPKEKTIDNKRAEKSIINISSSFKFNNVYFENNSVYPEQMLNNVNSNIPGFKDPLEEIEFERKKLLKKLEIEN
jgi:hypothetical protein